MSDHLDDGGRLGERRTKGNHMHALSHTNLIQQRSRACVVLLLTQVPSLKIHAVATEGEHYLEQTAYHILHSHNQRDGFTHTEIHMSQRSKLFTLVP